MSAARSRWPAEAGVGGRGDALRREAEVRGDRDAPSSHRPQSLQSRVSSLLAIALMIALGVALSPGTTPGL